MMDFWHLQRFNWLAGLPPSEVEAMRRASTAWVYQPGEAVFGPARHPDTCICWRTVWCGSTGRPRPGTNLPSNTFVRERSSLVESLELGVAFEEGRARRSKRGMVQTEKGGVMPGAAA